MVLRIVLAIVGLIGFPVVLLIDRDFVDLTSVVDIVLLSSLVMGGWMFLAGIIPSLLKILALKKSKNPKEDEMASSDSSKEEKQALARRKRIKKRQQKQSGTSDLKPDNKQKTRAKETDWSKALDPKRFESGRSFSMSYKDFNKGWKKIWGNFMTLLSKIKKSNRGKREDLQSDESKTARSKTSQSKTTQPKTKGDSENNHE
jgi:hypothetical protein